MSVPKVDSHGMIVAGDDGRPVFLHTLADDLLPRWDQYLGFYYHDSSGAEKYMPAWRYIESCCWIQLKQKKKDGNGQGLRMVPFEMNEGQIEIYQAICQMKKDGLPVRLNYGKARQLGGSTIISAIFWTQTAFTPDTKCAIIADTEAHGIELLNKYKTFYARTPPFLKKHLHELTNNSKELSFDYGDGHSSKFLVIVAGLNAGNSMTFNFVHESEVAKWSADIVDTLNVLDSTVSDDDPDSIIIRETTALRPEWKEIFQSSMAGKGTFRALFLPWWKEKGYRFPYDGHKLNEYESSVLKGKLGLDNDQIQFWRNKWENVGEDMLEMGREFPSEWTEMFKSMGGQTFDQDAIDAQKQWLTDTGYKPSRTGAFSCQIQSHNGKIDVSDVEWSDSRFGRTVIYDEPVPGHPYILNSDPSAGGEDEWVVQVWDNYEDKMVAEFAKSHCSEKEAFIQAVCLYQLYADKADIPLPGGGKAQRVLACCEMNTPSTFLEDMFGAGCKVYISRDETDMGHGMRLGQTFGYKTKQNNRQLMVQLLQEYVRDSIRGIKDLGMLQELENFAFVPQANDPTGTKGKPQATNGFHDDRVTCAMGERLIRVNWPATPANPKASSAKRRGFDPFDDNKRSKKAVFMDWR